MGKATEAANQTSGVLFAEAYGMPSYYVPSGYPAVSEDALQMLGGFSLISGEKTEAEQSVVGLRSLLKAASRQLRYEEPV